MYLILFRKFFRECENLNPVHPWFGLCVEYNNPLYFIMLSLQRVLQPKPEVIMKPAVIVLFKLPGHGIAKLSSSQWLGV